MSYLSELLANAKGERSIDDIANQATRRGAPISRAAVAKYLRGEHGPKPPEATLQALALGLDLDVRELRAAAGRQAGELGPYVPTERAASLTRAQREALDRLIVTIVEQNERSAGKTPAIDLPWASPELAVVVDDDASMQPLAARRGTSQRGKATRAQDVAGEENQDPGQEG